MTKKPRHKKSGGNESNGKIPQDAEPRDPELNPELNNKEHDGEIPESEDTKKRRFVIFKKEYLPIIRFIFITIVSLILFFWLIKNQYIETHFVAPYTDFVAASGRVALRLLGIKAYGENSLIASPEFSVNIMYVCNGLEVTAIFFATVLGFPARWRNKLLGLAIGYPVIYVINVLRIVVLFILGFKMPSIFETVHYYYAQAFVIIATVGVWLVWVSLYSAYGSKSSHRISD